MSHSDKLDRWTAKVATVFALWGGGVSIVCFAAIAVRFLTA